MKISYKHLLKNIINKPDLDNLSSKLFQLGHEHEIDGDLIDLELTPNRGDCLSIKGLLRDLNIFYKINQTQDLYEKNIDHFNFKFTNNAKDACPKISFLKIDIESIPNKYNDELESYFSALDIKKNNFFTDISNYISYETGQPTHCYEAAKIEAGLKLDFFNKKQEFMTLIEKKIEIDSGDLVFLNHNEELVNLAGVIGGANSSCNKNTKSVIVECAYFNPEVIIGKSTKYSINSDAAHKFERNVDPNCHEYVIRRFIKIVEDHTNISNIQFCSNEYSSIPKNVIKLNVNKISQILGIEIKERECKDYLQGLGFDINETLIHVPSHRHDIYSINDIAEEIARAIGYNDIEAKNFTIESNKDEKTINDNETKIKNLLVNNGFCEVVNDPFTSVQNDISIEVDNPLDANRRFLRTSLKNSLMEKLLYNERRQQDSIKLFEIADIYSLSSEPVKKFLGIIVSGRVDKNYEDFNRKLDKKYLANLLNKHIDHRLDLKYEVISRDGIKSKSTNTIAYIEIEFDETFKVNYSHKPKIDNNLDTSYVAVSDYPCSTRDLSFSIKDFSKCELLEDYILNFKDNLLKEVYIFDYYFNEKNSEIKIGFRFIFQSTKSTITEEEVNNIMHLIMAYTKSIPGIDIPGME